MEGRTAVSPRLRPTPCPSSDTTLSHYLHRHQLPQLLILGQAAVSDSSLELPVDTTDIRSKHLVSVQFCVPEDARLRHIKDTSLQYEEAKRRLDALEDKSVRDEAHRIKIDADVKRFGGVISTATGAN